MSPPINTQTRPPIKRASAVRRAKQAAVKHRQVGADRVSPIADAREDVGGPVLRVGGRRSNFGIAPGSPTETRPAFRTIQVRPKDWWTPARQAHDASNRLRPAVPTCYDRRRHLGGSPCPARGGGSSSHCSAVRRRVAAYGTGATAGDAARRLASQHTETPLALSSTIDGADHDVDFRSSADPTSRRARASGDGCEAGQGKRKD